MVSWYTEKEGGGKTTALVITFVVILLVIGVIGYANYF